MRGDEWDARVRQAAFEFLRRPDVAGSGQMVTGARLVAGFELDGRRIPLATQRGIFTPRACVAPLTLLDARVALVG